MGFWLGYLLGDFDGAIVGEKLGRLDCNRVGKSVGVFDGDLVGSKLILGFSVGDWLGVRLGDSESDEYLIMN